MKKGIEKTTMKKQVIVLFIVRDVIDLSRTVSFIKVASNSSYFSAYWFKTFKFTFENQEVQGVESFDEGDGSGIPDDFLEIFLERV